MTRLQDDYPSTSESAPTLLAGLTRSYAGGAPGFGAVGRVGAAERCPPDEEPLMTTVVNQPLRPRAPIAILKG